MLRLCGDAEIDMAGCRVELPGGERREMVGNDEIDLPVGAVFGM